MVGFFAFFHFDYQKQKKIEKTGCEAASLFALLLQRQRKSKKGNKTAVILKVGEAPCSN